MKTIKIDKPQAVKGCVHISGSKNSAIPIICSSLLKKKVVLYNVPDILDVRRLLNVLRYLGSRITFKRNKLIIINDSISYKPLMIEDCKMFRGSYYLIPIMINLFGKCEIALPGGCEIGQRPIDAHIDLFENFGCSVQIVEDYLFVKKIKDMDKHNYKLIKESIGASINGILMSLICDYAVIDNMLIEPEGEDLIKFLICLGYNISVFEKRYVFRGEMPKEGVLRYTIIPDRIETMTFIILGLLCGRLKIYRINKNHMIYPLKLLKDAGYIVNIKRNVIYVKKGRGLSFNVVTKPYPFFPTDMQSIFGVLMAFSVGQSVIEENIFENRMQIYNDINACGGNATVIGNRAYVQGVEDVGSSNFKANDLRHAAALLILCIKTGGSVENIDIIERGYADVYRKLKKVGIKFNLI